MIETRVDVFLYGTGEKLEFDKMSNLRGYDIISAWVNCYTGALELCVKKNNKRAVVGKGGYICFSDGRVYQGQRLLDKDELVKTNIGGVTQEHILLQCFTDCGDIPYGITFLDGNPDNHAISNMRAK